MPGLGQSRTRLAAPYLELPGQHRVVLGLTVNLVMQGAQFVGVPSRLPAVQKLERHACGGHDHLSTGTVRIRNGPDR